MKQRYYLASLKNMQDKMINYTENPEYKRIRTEPLIKETKGYTKGKTSASMRPGDDDSLPLSHDNILGTGAKMMKKIMESKNIPSLDFMIHLAKFEGIKFTACQMSMEVMGMTKDDLLDGIELAGVASMIEDARVSSMNYFI